MSVLAAPLDLGHVGRLGNQLHMIAATVAIAAADGACPVLPDDWQYRHVWDLPPDWFFPRSAMQSMPNVVNHPATEHLPERWRPYLQDVSLWWGHRVQVRRMFQTFTPDARGTIARESEVAFHGLPRPVLSLHVRRGDNVTNEPGTINLLDPEFYPRAAIAAWKRVPFQSAAIFTDDAEWCEANADQLVTLRVPWRVYHGVPRSKEYDAAYQTEPRREWIDLVLSSHCAAHVLSNSTFAWWGAFLANDPSPVYPSYWVGEALTGAGFDPRLLFPEHWTMVEARESATG